MASIEPRGRNTWRVVVAAGRGPDGKYRRISRTVHGTKRDAQRLAGLLEDQVRQGEVDGESTELFGDFLLRWLPTRPPQSLNWTEQVAGIVRRHIIPTLGHLPISQIRADRIATLEAEWLQRYAPSTVHSYDSVLRQAFKSARRWKLIRANPMEDVDAPSLLRKEAPVYTPDEVDQLLAALTAPAWADTPWPLVVRILADTGLRIGEVLGLRWQDVDWATSTLRIRQQWSTKQRQFIPVKTHRGERPVAIDGDLLGVLQTHRRAQAQTVGLVDLVACDPLGQPLTYDAWRGALRRVARQAGVRFRAGHALRHAHATDLLASGEPINVVSERLGHGSPSFTISRYGHALPGAQQQAAERAAERRKQRQDAAILPKFSPTEEGSA